MNTFLEIFNAFPAILESVQAVEAAIPLPQAGQQKLNLILAAAGTAWEFGQLGQQLSKGTTVQAVQSLTNLTVSTLNAAGVFGHSSTVATPAAPAPATVAPASPAPAPAVVAAPATAAPVSSN